MTTRERMERELRSEIQNIGEGFTTVREAVDTLLDILADAGRDLSQNSEWDGVVWQALIRHIKDNK